MKCPRCGQMHPIERFYISNESVSFAAGYRPVLSGFICDGWFYRVEAFRVDYEHVPLEWPYPPVASSIPPR